jgi:hypothetical protein
MPTVATNDATVTPLASELTATWAPTAAATARSQPWPETTSSATAVVPSATPAPAATEANPAPLLSGELITRTAHLDLYRIAGGLPATALLDLAPQFEQAIDRVGARMAARLSGRVALSFEPPQRGSCALRGLTLSHQRTIHLYYAPDTPEARIRAVVAHELAHQLQHDYYGWPAHQRSDLILLEGQATWASGDYALDDQGQPGWASAAERALAAGTLLPLDVSLEADCRTTTRNSAYTGWASFVAFLMTYGRERFDALYRSGKGHSPGSADYAGVYGKSLHELDQEWRGWLDTQRRSH